MLKFLKSIDIYGHPIGVLYKGQTTHKTHFGSLLSILTTAVVLAYSLQEFIGMITHDNQQENTRFIIADMNEQGKVSFDDHNFTMIF